MAIAVPNEAIANAQTAIRTWLILRDQGQPYHVPTPETIVRPPHTNCAAATWLMCLRPHSSRTPNPRIAGSTRSPDERRRLPVAEINVITPRAIITAQAVTRADGLERLGAG